MRGEKHVLCQHEEEEVEQQTGTQKERGGTRGTGEA